MPGWHDATRQLQNAGRFQMVGIIQEQHPDRARLFMQWKGMSWPILVDSLNLLKTSVVPQTLAIDEHGIVRLINPDKDRIEDEFLSKHYEAALAAEAMPPGEATVPRPTARASAGEWRAYGDQLFRWGPPGGLTDAITSYDHALALEPDDGPTHFRIGVAHRARYDSDQRQPDDFRTAVEQWEAALAIDPNNYIWRRRIQQYGPRLNKPYPFYDWVPTARAAIEARGAAPVPLGVEPGGAEFAEPAETFVTSDETYPEPDPGNRIFQDPADLIIVEALTVPTSIMAGSSTRVHLTFRPNLQRKAHWNNEAEDMVFWVNPPDGWEVDVRHVTVARPPQVVSQEPRRVEFEIRSPENAPEGGVVVPGYALYYVCEDVDGTCLYRRQDVAIEIGLLGVQ